MQAMGRIIAVQEGRFRLLTEQGQVYLLTLAHDAPFDMSDLQRLQRERTPVRVELQGEPNLRGGVARYVLEGAGS
jgi:hypothetical protein